jgi:hypothetical protein
MKIPALLHVAHIFDPKAPDKLEFIGAGELNVSEMESYIEEIFAVDVGYCEPMRLDFTADIRGSWVSWCRDNIRVRAKRRYQEETPTLVDRCVEKNFAQTIYWGKSGSDQHTAYDKTGQRRNLLMIARGKMTSEDRAKIGVEEHFQQEYGYSIFEQFTRFERRVVGKANIKTIGLRSFTDLEKTPFIKPFGKMVFPEEVMKKNEQMQLPKGINSFLIDHFKDILRRQGINAVRYEMHQLWPCKRTFYRHYNALLPFVLKGETGPTIEQITKAWMESTLLQVGSWKPTRLRKIVSLDAREIEKMSKEQKKKEWQTEQLEREIYSA